MAKAAETFVHRGRMYRAGEDVPDDVAARVRPDLLDGPQPPAPEPEPAPGPEADTEPDDAHEASHEDGGGSDSEPEPADGAADDSDAADGDGATEDTEPASTHGDEQKKQKLGRRGK